MSADAEPASRSRLAPMRSTRRPRRGAGAPSNPQPRRSPSPRPSAGSSPTRSAPPASARVHRSRRELPRPARGLGAAGIRVVATRHEGAAAFMAEAHGQLTGRPAVAIGHARRRRRQPRDRDPHRRPDSTPMFALVGQVERAFRGREAFQEVDLASTIGGLATHAVEIRDAADVAAAIGEAVRAALTGRPGPVLLSLPGGPARRDRCPAGRRSPRAPPRRRVRSRTRSARSSSSSPRPSDPSSSPAAASFARAPRPTSSASPSCSRCRSSPLAARRRHLERAPAVPRHGRLRRPAVGPRAPRGADAMLVARLPAQRDHDVRLRSRGGSRAGRMSTSSRARPAGPAAARAVRHARMRGRSCGPRSSDSGGAVLDDGRVDARRATNATDRAAWEAATVGRRARLGRPRRPSRPGRRDAPAASCPPTRS